jgi:hypothetical protein
MPSCPHAGLSLGPQPNLEPRRANLGGAFFLTMGGLAMAIFRCSKCGCDDDTALCNYWSARLQETPTICSACDPKIGKWHGEFPRKYEGPSAASPTRAVRNLIGLTRLVEAGQELAAANNEMAIIRR